MTKNVHDVTDRLPDGLAGNNIPDDFSIPSCGIEDVDRALFDKFDKEIGFTLEVQGEVRPVPVIFAGGERFALIKNKKPIRDENGTLILPLISIYRKSIDQSEDLSGLGRGIGQDTGELVIKKRLSPKDRDYQKIKNALNLKNQDNISSDLHLESVTSPQGNVEGTLGTRREIGARESKRIRGNLLSNELEDNIVEIITIPYPEFFKATYEITFWTHHVQHMNRMLETMMSAYDAQGNQFRIDSPKGYWFVAFVSDIFSADDNFEDYADDERIVRCSFEINTTGYIVATQHEGQRNPFRRYYSSPQMSFGIKSMPAGILSPRPVGNGTGDIDKFILSDVTELDKAGEPIVGRNHSPDKILTTIEDPFTGEKEKVYTRVLLRNQRSGETVARLTDIDNILTD